MIYCIWDDVYVSVCRAESRELWVGPGGMAGWLGERVPSPVTGAQPVSNSSGWF